VRERLDLRPYQEVPSPPMTPELFAACAGAFHVITVDGRVLRAGRAAVRMMDRLGWPRAARVLGARPCIWFMEAGYAMVAGHRPFFARFLFTREDGLSVF